MAIWGKIIGAATGLWLGGPIGGLIGGLAGHAYDRYSDDTPKPLPPPEEAVKSVAFTIGTIALAAKMAKADGRVTAEEIAAFREVIRVEPEELGNVQRVFDLARRDVAGFEVYARQVADLFQPGSPLLEELLGALCHIARADGRIHDGEHAYLAEVARIFGFNADDFDRIALTHLGESAARQNPYRVLGVRRDDPPEAIRKAYLALVRDHHPDRLIAQGLPPEAIAVANETLASVNAAWEAIKRDRGLT